MAHMVIVGAGGGLGLSIARRFGGNSYKISLMARDPNHLDHLVRVLVSEGVEAAGHVTDVRQPDGIPRAFAAAQDRFGDVDVMEYSPAVHNPDADLRMVGVLDVTAQNLRPQLELVLLGAVVATQQVLPGMLERGAGTLLYTTGASSTQPLPRMGNYGPAAAALRHYVLGMHAPLLERGVLAAHVPIAVFIGGGDPDADPDRIASVYWDLHTSRDRSEHPYGVVTDRLRGRD